MECATAARSSPESASCGAGLPVLYARAAATYNAGAIHRATRGVGDGHGVGTGASAVQGAVRPFRSGVDGCAALPFEYSTDPKFASRVTSRAVTPEADPLVPVKTAVSGL